MPLLFLLPAFGQDSVPVHFPRFYLSANLLNICYFQQKGLTFEYRPGRFGYALYGGYIYPNRKEYSNYFIAGPTNYGSLGWYHGFFAEPQLNVYFRKPKPVRHSGTIYLALKGVYKYMTSDSGRVLQWYTHTDEQGWIYRRQYDRMNVYGAFVDFGYRYVLYYAFIDLNIGVGFLGINHNLIVTAESTGSSKTHSVNPPRKDKENDASPTINFTINIGLDY